MGLVLNPKISSYHIMWGICYIHMTSLVMLTLMSHSWEDQVTVYSNLKLLFKIFYHWLTSSQGSCLFSFQRSQLTVAYFETLFFQTPKPSQMAMTSCCVCRDARTLNGHLAHLLSNSRITLHNFHKCHQTINLSRHGKLTTSQAADPIFFKVPPGRKLRWEWPSWNFSSSIQVVPSELYRGNLFWDKEGFQWLEVDSYKPKFSLFYTPLQLLSSQSCVCVCVFFSYHQCLITGFLRTPLISCNSPTSGLFLSLSPLLQQYLIWLPFPNLPPKIHPYSQLPDSSFPLYSTLPALFPTPTPHIWVPPILYSQISIFFQMFSLW